MREELARMRLEGHHRRFQVLPAGCFTHLGEQRLMPAMHTVEITDR